MYSGGFGGGHFGGGPGGGPGSGRGGHFGAPDDSLGKVYDVKVIRRLPKYIGWTKKYFVFALPGTITRTAANLAMPLIIGIATDRFIKTKDLRGLGMMALIFLGTALLMWGGQYLEMVNLSRAGQGILLKLRTEMFGHLQKLSMAFFDNHKVGALMSRVQNDVDQLQTLLTQDIVSLVVDMVTLAVIAIIMVSMNVQLGLLTLTVVPILGAVLLIWQKRARRTFMRVRQAIAAVNDNLQESISGIRVTQSVSREQVNLGQFDAVNRANLEVNVQAARLQAFMAPTVQILTDGSFVLVLVFGGIQVLNGTMGVGVLLAFLLYIQRFFQPVMELTQLYTDLQRAMAAGARIFELLDVEPDVKDKPGAVAMSPVKGQIKFDGVSFAYEPGKDVLHDIDLTINPGETVAIVGRTGAGKSSLTSLIARFYDPTQGEVMIDGTNVTLVSQLSLRQQIGIVPQEPFLFSGTIEDNIRHGRMDATHEEIVEAAKAAGAHEFISRQEHGYATQVGERGGSLSAGQRQLVCLARAVLADPPILILDEATSSVDTNTERIMQESLRRLSEGRTCVVIAHRLSTVTSADRIIVLERGRIVETGSHEELMAKNGLYHDMFETLSATTTGEITRN